MEVAEVGSTTTNKSVVKVAAVKKFTFIFYLLLSGIPTISLV